jgi:hypothetical protein
MKYFNKKNQGEKFIGIPKRIYNFPSQEKLDVVLIYLIKNLGKEV